jgi:hypothetical protein
MPGRARWPGRRAPAPRSLLSDAAVREQDHAVRRWPREAHLISWVTTIIVIPSSASVRMTSSTSRTSSGVKGGRRLVEGMTAGSIASAWAMATRCCWPPERLSG